MRVEDEVRSIEAYTYDRYVRGTPVSPIDERRAARFLEDFYSLAANAEDPNCCYAGILWFEISFLPEEEQDACLQRARAWLERAHGLSESPWEPIEERLADIRTMLGDDGAAGAS